MIPLPSSQFSDVKPALQLHVYESPDWVQCPPFSHGFGKQGDISSERKKTKQKKTGMVRCEIIKTDINYCMMAVQHYRRYIYRHILCKECYATKCQQNIVVIVSQNSVELFFLRRVQQRTHCKIRLYQRLTGTKLKISATKLPKAA